MKKDWLKNPDVCAKVTAAVLLLALFLGIHFFADDFFNKTFTLAISGNVNDKPVTPEEVIAWAEKNVKKYR